MRSRLTYANVVSTLALFGVIAGGTAVALPGRGSVGANDLRRDSVGAAALAADAVRSAEIEKGAVRSKQVANQGLEYRDLGSNSVVARIRSTAPTESGNGGQANPVTIPLSGNTWTQAADEVDVFFGELTFSQTAACTNGNLRIEFLVDGTVIDSDSYDENGPVSNMTTFYLATRPWVFEPGAANERTASVRIYDDCDMANENFTVESLKANAVAIR